MVLNWLQSNGSILTLLVTVILVIITGAYVYFTKRILDSSIRQLNLLPNPVIGILIESMDIGKVFGPSRRNLSIGLKLINIGNAPAIEIIIDGEIILQYSNINGEKVIPSRFEPESIPFISQGQEISKNNINLSFGNTCVTHLLDDFRESHRLNIHRIKTNPTKEFYKASKLHIYVYYQNNLGQYFHSSYETYLDLKDIPEDNKTTILSQIYIPRPKFYANPISSEEINKNIANRNKKRDLCGW
jgi:hypothetical protein